MCLNPIFIVGLLQVVVLIFLWINWRLCKLDLSLYLNYQVGQIPSKPYLSCRLFNSVVYRQNATINPICTVGHQGRHPECHPCCEGRHHRCEGGHHLSQGKQFNLHPYKKIYIQITRINLPSMVIEKSTKMYSIVQEMIIDWLFFYVFV